ncbi:MAG: hypothetical protein AAF383_00420 [Cyanobacteria bacterium P01_A01_bin.83]
MPENCKIFFLVEHQLIIDSKDILRGTNDLDQLNLVWNPQFIKEINQDICLDCERFNEVCGSNALGLQSMNQNGINSQSQDRIISVVNLEECASCAACMGKYTNKPYAHSSFLYAPNLL